jgi:hypothetical protein
MTGYAELHKYLAPNGIKLLHTRRFTRVHEINDIVQLSDLSIRFLNTYGVMYMHSYTGPFSRATNGWWGNLLISMRHRVAWPIFLNYTQGNGIPFGSVSGTVNKIHTLLLDRNIRTRRVLRYPLHIEFLEGLQLE